MSNRITPRRALFNPLSNLLAFGFGSGLAPFAPGTFGTLIAIPLFLLISGLPFIIYAALVLLAFMGGVMICKIAADSLASHDHPAIVWDEIVGYLITMALIPISMITVILGFALFRLFDIVKPWPIRQIDNRVAGGLGIMLDDVLAGVYANICLITIL